MTGTAMQYPKSYIDQATKIALLQQAQTYPEYPGRIDIVETHMSWVFLTKYYAYKLKKPVRYDFLDFSTLGARKQDCADEVRLNRRLAADVYLGMVPLVVDAAGRARLEAKGEVIDWLVKMRRLPADRMLDYKILQQSLTHSDIHRLARMLAAFYQGCAAVDIGADEYRARFEHSVRVNFAELKKVPYGLPDILVHEVHQAQLKLLQSDAELFDQRVSQGKIIEGHGDLRPEHVCLEEVPVIFDCLEFNRQFRIVDMADELASLSMECELIGAPEVGNELFLVYESATKDRPARRLIHFYKSYRACVRARLAILHTQELKPSLWPKWRDRAVQYLLLARGYA